MRLSSIELSNFRNYDRLRLDIPDARTCSTVRTLRENESSGGDLFMYDVPDHIEQAVMRNLSGMAAIITA